MIKVVFYTENTSITGFEISGHAYNNTTKESDRIVCSAVSSASYMAANTITDVCNCKADIEVDNGYMRLTVKPSDNAVQVILQGLKIHLKNLSKQYPKFIKITTEVQNNA